MAKAWWRDSDYELFARLTKERDEARAEVESLTDERDELLVRVADQGAELRATRESYNEARSLLLQARGAVEHERDRLSDCEHDPAFCTCDEAAKASALLATIDALNADPGELRRRRTLERDEARSKLADLTNEWAARRCECGADDFCKIARERDEARAEVERLTAEVEMLRGGGCCESDKLYEPPSGPCGVCRKCAYRRGAEAMREALLKVLQVERASWNPEGHTAALLFRLSGTISALPIPEEP